MKDLERLRGKLAQLKNPEKGKFNSQTWNPPKKDGEEKLIRLVEYPFSEDPFPELWFHYKIGPRSLLCPKKNDGRECAVCEGGKLLWQEWEQSGKKDEEKKKLAKTCMPVQRFYTPMFERGVKDPVVKYWGFGVEVYQKLLETLTSARTMHMLDADKGFDIFVYTHNKANAAYRKTDFRNANEDTPVAATKEETQKLLSSIKPLREVFKPLTPSEIKKALNDWINAADFDPNKLEEKNASETTRGGGEEETEASLHLQDSSDDIESAFERASGR